jgi:hypothetical protein
MEFETHSDLNKPTRSSVRRIELLIQNTVVNYFIRQLEELGQ